MDLKVKIMETLERYPEGIHFNALCRKFKKICARQTFSNALEELRNDGLVTRNPKNPRKGEKIFYKSTAASKELTRDFQRIGDLYSYYHLELIMSDFFVERGHQYQLSLSPGVMEKAFSQGLVTRLLLNGLQASAKYKEKARRHLQEYTVEIFLAIQDEYFAFLRRHPKFKAKVQHYIRKAIVKAAREMRNAVLDLRKEGSDFFVQKMLDHDIKQRMIKDFSEWIDEEEIEDKENLKAYFESKLLVFETG